MPDSSTPPDGSDVPIIRLANYQGRREAWGKPAWVVALWLLAEWAFVTNSLQVSSSLRIAVLRAFGANIGSNVIFRPRTRVKTPWKLTIGSDCWIGEGVWFHNQADVVVGNDVVISQETFLTTGSHALRRDMSLITKPIAIDDGVWVTSRCIVLGGTHIGRSSVIRPATVVTGEIDSNLVFPSGPEGVEFRFPSVEQHRD